MLPILKSTLAYKNKYIDYKLILSLEVLLPWPSYPKKLCHIQHLHRCSNQN